MKLGKQVTVSTIAYILNFLLSPISIKILTTSLSSSDYGIYSLVFSFIGIITVILGCGFDKYLFVKIPGEENTKGFSYFTSVFIFEFIITSLVVILLIFFGNLFIKHFNFSISYQSIIIIGLFLFVGVLTTESLRFHGLRKRLEFKSIMGLLQAKLWILPLMFFWMIVKNLTFNQILLIRFYPSIFILFISLWMMKKQGETIGDNKIIDKEVIIEGLAFGIPLITINVGNILLATADRYIIALFYSSKSVGYYSLVYGLANIAYALTASIIWVFSPYFAEAYNRGKKNIEEFYKAKYIFNYSLRFCLIISLFVCTLFIFLRIPFIQIISSKEYLVAATTLAILSPFPILMILAYLFSQILVLEKQKNILLWGNIYAPLLNIVLNFILIPKFWINGAAISTVVSYFLICIYFLLKIKMYNVIKISKFYFIKLGVSLFIATIPMYLLNPTSIVKLLYTVIISGVIYLVSLIILKIITKNDWYFLWGENEYVK